MESVKKPETFQLALSKQEEKIRKRRKTIAGIKTNKLLYLMILPGILYFVIFKYLPMGGASHCVSRLPTIPWYFR